MDEEIIASLRAKLNAVGRRLAGGLTMKVGGAQAEKEYSMLYEQLVKMGVVQRLRKKYRGG